MRHNPGFLQLVEQARQRIRECTVQDVKAAMDRGQPWTIVDIREDHEFALGSVKGADHIGRAILEQDIELHFPEKQTEIVLYCGGGYRSALAADALGQMGYTNVRSMIGGIKSWRQIGYPMEGE